MPIAEQKGYGKELMPALIRAGASEPVVRAERRVGDKDGQPDDGAIGAASLT